METKVEVILLDDGRRAERHTTVADDGTQTIEVYTDERRPLILESKVVTEAGPTPQPVPERTSRAVVPPRPEPLFKAQAVVEANVLEKKAKSDAFANYGLVAMLVLQIAAMLAALLLL